MGLLSETIKTLLDGVGSGYIASGALTPAPAPKGTRERFNQDENANAGSMLSPLAQYIKSRAVEMQQRGPAVESRPLNERVYLNSIVGGDNRPITEKDFRPEELDALRAAAVHSMNRTTGPAPKGSIQYIDYEKASKASGGWEAIAKAAGPEGAVATTIGRANYAKDAAGNLIVRDTYDFDPHKKDMTLHNATYPTSSLGNFLEHASGGRYGIARWLGTQVLPPGGGRKVSVNLGKVDAVAHPLK